MVVKLFLIITVLVSSFQFAVSSTDLSDYDLDSNFKVELKQYYKKINQRKNALSRDSNPININESFTLELLRDNHQKNLENFEKIKILMTDILIQHDYHFPMKGYQHHELRRSYTSYINNLALVMRIARGLLPSTLSPQELFNHDENQDRKILWLMAHSILVNDYLLLCDLVYYNTFTRLYLNMADQAYSVPKNNLDQLNKYLNNSDELFFLKSLFKQLRYEIEHYDNGEIFNEASNVVSDLAHYKKILNNDVYLKVSKPIDRLMLIIRDSFQNSVSNMGFAVSMVFGNFAGNTKIRQKGYLYNQQEIKNQLLKTLRPLDILLDKNYNRLSNYLITSHFGHAAIWLGTKEQLLAIGKWDHPTIQPFQREIEKGNVILESIRGGVRLGSLDEFLDIDEIAIFRYKEFERREYLIDRVFYNGLIQLNRPYDFNFDTYTSGTVICSELVYQAFDFIDWETDYMMFRHVIDPDHIAKKALNSFSDFAMILYLTSSKGSEFTQRNLDYLKRVLKIY